MIHDLLISFGHFDYLLLFCTTTHILVLMVCSLQVAVGWPRCNGAFAGVQGFTESKYPISEMSAHIVVHTVSQRLMFGIQEWVMLYGMRRFYLAKRGLPRIVSCTHVCVCVCTPGFLNKVDSRLCVFTAELTASCHLCGLLSVWLYNPCV